MKQATLSRVAAGAVTLLLAFTLPVERAFAQAAYPARPVRIIVPFPPGGPSDALARLTGDRLSRSLAQPFVIALRVRFDAARRGRPVGQARSRSQHPRRLTAPRLSRENRLSLGFGTVHYARSVS